MSSPYPYRRTPLLMLLWQTILLIGLNVVVFLIIQFSQLGPHQDHRAFLRTNAIGGAILVALDIALILLYLRLQRRPLTDSGLGGTFKAPLLFMAGILLWWASASGLSLIFGWQWVQDPGALWNGSFTELIVWTFISMLVVFILPVELVSHGLIFPGLQQYSVVLALLVPALLLTPLPLLMGIPGVALLIFLISVVAGLLRWASGTLWLPVGFLGAMMTATETLQLQPQHGAEVSFMATKLPLYLGPAIVATVVAIGILLVRKSKTLSPRAPEYPGLQPRPHR